MWSFKTYFFFVFAEINSAIVLLEELNNKRSKSQSDKNDYSEIRDPSTTFTYMLEKVDVKLVPFSGDFSTSKYYAFGECKIKEVSFTLDAAARSGVMDRGSLTTQKRQLFYFLHKAYSKYNNKCIIVNKKWDISHPNKKDGTKIWIASNLCKFNDICCLYKFVCTIEADSISVDVFRNKKQCHPDGIQLTRQLNTAERYHAKKDLAVLPPCKVAAKYHKNVDEEAARHGRLDTFSEGVLRKAKNELVNDHRYDPDVYRDLLLMKANNECVDTISLSPFNVTCHDDRVTAMIKDRQFEDTFYLDGTGQLVENQDSEKRVMVYDIIGCHKLTNRKIPIAHITTGRHRGIDFSMWLQWFCFLFNDSFRTPFTKFVKRVVIDVSWALMHAVVNGLNGQKNIKKYIEDCYEVLTNKKPLDFVVIQFCFSHFMKIVSKFIKQKTKVVAIHYLFLNSMRAGAKLESLDEIKDWFSCVVAVFSSPCLTPGVKKSTSMLERIISKTKSKDKVLHENYSEEWEKIKEIDQSFYDEKDEEQIDEEAATSFSDDFKKIVLNIKNEIIDQTNGRQPENPFFVSEVFGDQFFKKFILLTPFPLWTNLFGKYCESKKKTVSNASIEGWFKNLKQYVCLRMKNMLVNKFLRLRNEHLDGIVKLLRGTNQPQGIFSSLANYNKKKTNVLENSAAEEDKWKSAYKPRVNTTISAFKR